MTVVSTVSLAVQWLAFGLLLLVVLAALLILYKGKDWHLGNVWYVFAFLGLGLLAFLYWAEFMVSISTTVEDDDKNAPPS